jgi:glycerate dehydrogenase
VERIQSVEVAVSNKAPVSAAAISNADSLKLIAVLATGTNNVDLDAAAKRGIVVCNARGYAAASVAQHTLALMLNLATQIPNYLTDVSNGLWHQKQTFALVHRPIFELSGKTLGIVGYGDLGQAVAKLAEAFGMNVLISARPGHPNTKIEADRLSFSDLLTRVDFLSLHCPLTKDNHHLINRETIRQMKKGAFLINTARGGLVDDQALIEALQSGHLAGAAVDTVEVEPPSLEDLLITAAADTDNLMVTPHSAWGAKESRVRLVEQVAANIIAFQQGQPQNVVTA